ncbi:MAG: hypothetical protein CTY15_11905 [Methylocystis sp.]|nr:MAG: hypothetical protein CTY15_11905 [Methylocystis sp.]
MRKRLFASLIVCVALLTQLGASFWGAAAARDGYAGCHKQSLFSLAAAAQTSGEKGVPAAPATHDHASCSLCQLAFAAIDADPPALPARSIKPAWRIAFVAAEPPPRPTALNRSAPARAPPSHI